MPPKEIKNRERNSVKLDANNNSRLVIEQSSSIPFRSTKKLSYSMEKITWSSSNSSLSSSSTSSSSPTKTGGIKLNNQVSETSKPILRICGNLEKMSLSGLKLWRKRYFVLTDNILQYFSDPSKSKHCGTIFLSGTYTRPTIKKDGSAFNKKYSFKVDMIRPNLNQSVMSRVSAKNNDCAYFAADSLEHMNEWINYFNLASQIKANNRSRDKSQFGKTSHGSSSIRSSSSESVNHVTSDHNGTLANHEPSKRSISAPNSPMAAKHSITINENANKIHPLSTTIQAMPSSSRRSQSSNSRSNKEIYESFEKPIKHSNDRQKSVIVNLVRSTNNTDSNTDKFKKSNMDREKIAAATIAANNAAAAAIAKEKEKSRLMAGQKPINSSYLLTQKQQHMDQTDNSINMFYNLSMLQMDILPKIIEKLFKNQAITHSKELPNGVHLLNQLNSLNHNMELLQSQLAEFNLILNDSMRQQQNERQQHLSHANGAVEMYSHLFLNNPTPQNGEEDFNQNESVKINSNPNPNPNPIGFNQHLRSGFKPVNESRSVNFKRDLLLTNGNNMRPLVGKMPSNYYSQNTTMFESKSNELLFKPIPIKSYQPLSNANKIFAANNMRMEASQFEIQKAFMDSQLEEHGENPETKLNPALSQIINDIAHQNEMEYFDIDQYGKDLVNILYPEKEFRINEIS